MGADLILQCAEIPADASPKWGVAKQHIERMTDAACLEAVAEQQQMPVSEVEAELDYMASDCRSAIMSAYKEIREVWEGEPYRKYLVLNLYKTKLIVAANTSWGDPVEEVDTLTLFITSGAAEAAGFLFGKNRSSENNSESDS